MMRNEIVQSLFTLRNVSHDGPEGFYNEHSLIDELLNHLNEKPKMSPEDWYDNFYTWEKYVKRDVRSRFQENFDYWNRYLDNFFDRMDFIHDLAELIFK